MESIQKNVQIKLQTTIDDQGVKEQNEIVETGKFYKRGKMDVIIFDETMDGDFKVKNLITIQNGSVNIKRTGPVSMNQRFDINHRTENVYKHPHGTIHMETFTRRITYKQKSESEGQLSLLYTVRLNGQQDERKHELTLIFKEEDSE
ncbi:DUF1934 domain-containing protein [Oceanobacillus salinisoli]|uniref:DUF1934 domain-containing protein n=1 Tax=Oceanobacillus salinisoli TaxID=2678611 RepID=UPI0012E2DEA9|nr:DUF1934 domain-containing protein [Oceanobacillus salinisoli]